MCDLLGLAFNRPVRCNISLEQFKNMSEIDPDGWGIAYYMIHINDSSQCTFRAKIIKEPQQMDKSKKARKTIKRQDISSSNIIVHLRDATDGVPVLDNTHPFVKKLNETQPIETQWVFAHNGVVTKAHVGNIKATAFTPTGETDSEFLFCDLMQWFTDKQITVIDAGTEEGQQLLKELEHYLQLWNARGSLNLLFSNGTQLFAFHSHHHYQGMKYFKREKPYGDVYYDNDLKVQMEGGPASGYIIYTENAEEDLETAKIIIEDRAQIGYSEEQNIAADQLIVFENGKIVFPLQLSKDPILIKSDSPHDALFGEETLGR